jgi:hypothetical protein
LGFLVGNSESFKDFRERLLGLFDALKEFDSNLEQAAGEIELFEDIKVVKDRRIPIEVIDEASQLTEKYYYFSINWVPGFFASKNIGWLWGGCAIYDASKSFILFLIRSSFMNKRKWFIYERRELLAHELCHVARNVIDDDKLEEFFAYQTAPSRLRRYIGNCFINKSDSLLFLLSTLVLLMAQLLKTFSDFTYPMWPFWIVAFAYPVYLLLRNNMARMVFFRACSKLIAFDFVDAPAILFRCDWEEIKKISTLASPEEFRRFVQNLASNNLRWKVIQHRFVIHNIEREKE